MRLPLILASAALATAAAAVIPAVPASAQQTLPANFKAEADAILEAAYRADQPGAAAIVMRGGEVIYVGARGLADVETRKPIAPDTAFRVGSITKQFTAATVLTLVAEGKLSLDDPLSRFFPDWPQPGARATVRQLLNHTSGLAEFTGIPGYMGSEATLRPVTTGDLLAVIRSAASASAPGEVWRYNNSGYVVLGAIVEQVTGMPWHEAVRERLARPLGLETVAYGPADEGDPALALPYSAQGGGFVASRGVHLSVGHAAGALVGSVEDLARWTQALHHGRVVRPDLHDLMTSPAPLNDGRTGPYGFGLHLIEFRGQPAYRHGGAARGVDTGSVYFPSEDLFVAVFTNSDDLTVDASTTVRRLAALALGDPFPLLTRAAVEPAALEPLFGLYAAESGDPIRFLTRDGKLYFGRGDDEIEAFPAGGDRFFFGPDELRWFRFERSPGSAPTIELHFREDGTIERALRTGPPPAPVTVAREVLQRYVGTYTTEGPPLAIALDTSGQLTLSAAGQTPQAMRPITETEFATSVVGLRIRFLPEGDEVNRLTLSIGEREFHGTRSNP